MSRQCAGNETTTTYLINFDTTGPVVTIKFDREADLHGWYNEPVDISLEALQHLVLPVAALSFAHHDFAFTDDQGQTVPPGFLCNPNPRATELEAILNVRDCRTWKIRNSFLLRAYCRV